MSDRQIDNQSEMILQHPFHKDGSQFEKNAAKKQISILMMLKVRLVKIRWNSRRQGIFYCFIHAIVTCMRMPFKKKIQILYIFAQTFKYFALFCPFFALFLKNRTHVLTLQNRPCKTYSVGSTDKEGEFAFAGNFAENHCFVAFIYQAQS